MSLKGIYSSSPSPGGLPFPISFPHFRVHKWSQSGSSLSRAAQRHSNQESSQSPVPRGGGCWLQADLGPPFTAASSKCASQRAWGCPCSQPPRVGWRPSHWEWELAASDTRFGQEIFHSHLLARAEFPSLTCLFSITHVLAHWLASGSSWISCDKSGIWQLPFMKHSHLSSQGRLA